METAETELKSYADGKAAAAETNAKAFYAAYGQTTCAEVEAAYQSGKAIYCIDGNNVYPLITRYGTDKFAFAKLADGIIVEYIDLHQDVWNLRSYQAAAKSDITAEISTHNSSTAAHSDIRTVLNAKAPMYQYGTDDLEAGVSSLAEGVLYFVYE